MGICQCGQIFNFVLLHNPVRDEMFIVNDFYMLWNSVRSEMLMSLI